MSRSRRRHLAVAASVVVLALVSAACAADIPEADPADDGADALVWTGDGALDPGDVDLSGVDLAVGSKDLPEEEILGWIAVEALRSTGADVHQEVGLGRTVVARQAEQAGLIDAYWEYTGTGWLNILQQTDPATDPTELYEAVRDRDQEQNQITWLPPAPANSSFAFAATPETQDRLDVHSLDDLADLLESRPEDATFCLDSTTDFGERPDGLRQFERAYDVTVPTDQIASVETDELYEAVGSGAFCAFGQVFNTDPRLADGTLDVLDDDGTFVIYQPAMTVRTDVLDDVPEIADLFAVISPRLTDEVLRELRSQVELDGDPARDVARDWLVAQGLVEVDDTREGG